MDAAATARADKAVGMPEQHRQSRGVSVMRWLNAIRDYDWLRWKVSRLEQQNWEMDRWACGLEQHRNEAWEETRRFSAILAESDQRGVETYTRMMEEAYGCRHEHAERQTSAGHLMRSAACAWSSRRHFLQ